MGTAAATSRSLVARFRVWAAWAVAAGALLYAVGAVWADLDRVGGELARFAWALYVPVLLLTLLNYGLRFVKWHLLLAVLNVRVPWRIDAGIFLAGLSMVISPGKAGELLKPYLVSRRTRTPMAVTIPALVGERLTDGVAMLLLAAISVGTYAADRRMWLIVPGAAVALGLAILASERLTGLGLRALRAIPLLRRAADPIERTLDATRACLAPRPFLMALALSLVAWGAECVGYWLVLRGLEVPASLDAATFLYAFATVAGGAMPGGLGIADGALVTGALAILPATESSAVAAALLIRVATLWFGVLLGAFALFRFEALLEGGLPEEA